MSKGPDERKGWGLMVPKLEDVPFAQLLGIKIAGLERGLATLVIQVREEFKQNHGVVHGGVIAALMDTAAAYSVATLLSEGETTTTIDMTIHYLEAVTAGEIAAKAIVRRAGGRVFVISIEVTNLEGSLIATAIATFLRRKPR